ncbi:hypothetical protein DL237_16110 [Pseudooceanicola sediminis]|uniref:YrhK domain-containing protein n=1 Tax=Pseudooceanicola sediminis TaxID=2211117 RepID=A0A399IXH6_9RHOB|nr:YrhK family protein [Pseudooceanicola sediminis]KAA2312944.1 hypothetical protein E0K93_15755 [Puniceibacterium sp. HSS470]RII37721.1 hypothetical protein DL237_16110 [Pseudooceanicola sediminis]
MTLFRHENRQRTEHSKRLYARFEIAYTLVDFGAAFCFVLGSIFFFSERLMTPGTWLFLIGSLLFAAKPTLRLVREIKLYRMGDQDDLASRLKD